MKHHKNNLIYVSLISILLLIGQLAVLVHAEEHPFHESHESCDVFVAAEQTDSTLAINNIDLPVIKNDVSHICFIISELSISLSVYQARAPPFFS
ncbi:MAG: hypothetical protein GQ546_06745 [Gammaproteobacteria bacterium]|nr:hypothetical protein [Gammaproteobacteria bacterium]